VTSKRVRRGMVGSESLYYSTVHHTYDNTPLDLHSRHVEEALSGMSTTSHVILLCTIVLAIW